MPLPVAHGLLAASIAAALQQPYEKHRGRILLVAAFLGVFPDFDYALNWLRISGGGWHHGFSHSILFALCMGLVTGSILGGRRLRSFILFSCAAVSHPLLDYLMTESTGVALWWPFNDLRYSLRLPNPIDYTWRTSVLWRSVIDLLKISLVELMIFAPILLIVLWARKYWWRGSEAAPGSY